MKEKINKVLFSLLLIVLIPILLLNITIIIKSLIKTDEIPSVFGIKPMIVLTGSMESTIMTGDLIFSKEVETNTLKVKDIISFRDNTNAVVTHRIEEIIQKDGKLKFVTKGDFNNTRDEELVSVSKVEGIYIGRIPKLGSVINYVQTPTGIVVMVMALIIISLLLIVVSKKEDNKEFKEYKKEKQLEKKD